LGHLTRKTVPEMTYIVFSGTLNPTHLHLLTYAGGIRELSSNLL